MFPKRVGKTLALRLARRWYGLSKRWKVKARNERGVCTIYVQPRNTTAATSRTVIGTGRTWRGCLTRCYQTAALMAKAGAEAKG